MSVPQIDEGAVTTTVKLLGQEYIISPLSWKDLKDAAKLITSERLGTYRADCVLDNNDTRAKVLTTILTGEPRISDVFAFFDSPTGREWIVQRCISKLDKSFDLSKLLSGDTKLFDVKLQLSNICDSILLLSGYTEIPT